MNIPIQKSNTISDRLLQSWIRCKRKAWLDLFAEKDQRIWSAHRALQLDHQQRSFTQLIPYQFGKGIQGCEKGNYGVMGIRLKGIGPSGELLEAHPPLLQRVQGESCWGPFQYRPVLARQGRKPTREQKLSLTLYGILLEQLQQKAVSSSLIISKTKDELQLQSIPLNQNLRKQLFDSLIKLNSDLTKNKKPPITSDRRKCAVCAWRNYCQAEATKNGHLSEVSGIGAKREQILISLGINNLAELAASNPIVLAKKLEKYGVQHSENAHQFVKQASCQNNGLEERLNKIPALPEILNSPGILIYDIESDPDEQDDFLHGFVRIKRNIHGALELKNAKYHPLLILNKHGKAIYWKRLHNKLNSYKDWPVIHYGETELISFMRLAKSQTINQTEISKISTRFIDIHARLKRHWRLPLNSYGLKTVANWTGFQWHKNRADGARALLWWRQWKRAKNKSINDKNLLKYLLEYNQDDCIATWSVAEWLLKKDSLLQQ